jgi:uncharacterized protein
MFARLIGLRYLVIVAYLSVILVAGFGAARLTIDPNNRVFFSDDHHHYANLLDLEAAFGSNTNLVFVISAEQDVLQNSDLRSAIRWINEQAWTISRVVSVDSVYSVPVVEDRNGELVVEGLLDHVCPGGMDSRCRPDRKHRFYDGHVQGRFVDASLKTFAVVAKVDLVDPASTDISMIAGQAGALKQEFGQKYPHYPIYLTGAVPMMQAFMLSAEADASTLMVVALAVLTIGLYVFLGSIVATVFVVLLGASSVLITLGVAGYLGFVLNTATATVPLIVFTLVVASAMHLFLHIVREPQLVDNQSIRASLMVSLSSNWLPITLTALTTVVGLLSMLFVTSPPMKQLGILSATGVAIGGVLTLTVVPCAFSFLTRIKASNYLLSVQRWMNSYAKWMERVRPRMLWVVFPFILAVLGLARLSIDEDFVRYFSESSEFRSDTEQITNLLFGPYHLEIVVDSGLSQGMFEPESLAEVSSLARYITSLRGVVSVASLVDVMQEAKFALTGRSELSESSSDELAQYFLTYELSLGVGHSSTEFLDADYRRARISVLLGDVSMGRIRALASSIEQWVEENPLSGGVTVTGEGMPTAYLSSESIREMSSGIVLSVVFSALVVAMFFGRGVISVLILAATAFPIFAAFGVWGWLDSEIGMAAVLVVATTIGVVIDDTIHLTYRYVDGVLNQELTSWGATAYAVHKSGTAILVNSLVLAGGLLTLAASEFRMNSAFGFCASLVIVLALAYSMTIAPWLLGSGKLFVREHGR